MVRPIRPLPAAPPTRRQAIEAFIARMDAIHARLRGLLERVELAQRDATRELDGLKRVERLKLENEQLRQSVATLQRLAGGETEKAPAGRTCGGLDVFSVEESAAPTDACITFREGA